MPSHPVLPTTPFLLLAVVLFAKGSDRFHHWFLSTKLYHRYLADFVTTHSMTIGAKIKVLTIVTMLLGIGFYYSPWFGKMILAIIAVSHYMYFLFDIGTVEKDS